MSLLTALLVGTLGFSPLTLCRGTRAAAMADAGSEFSHHADAVFGNPAGQAFAEALDAAFEHNTRYSDWYSLACEWSVAAAVPLTPDFSVGLHAVGEQFVRDPFFEFTPEKYTSLGLSVTHRPVDFLAIGGTVNYNHSYREGWGHQGRCTLSGRSVSADVGMMVDVPIQYDRLRAGFSGLNLGTLHTYRIAGLGPREPDTLPYAWRASVGYAMNIRRLWGDAANHIPGELAPFKRWLVDNWDAELNYTVNRVVHDQPAHAVGLELRPLPVLAGRIGYLYAPSEDTADTRKGWTWGIGLDFKFLRVDIARDAPLFYDSWCPQRLRYGLAVNIGEPVLPEGGLFGHSGR